MSLGWPGKPDQSSSSSVVTSIRAQRAVTLEVGQYSGVTQFLEASIAHRTYVRGSGMPAECPG
jgi:hypothetical protein